eukprot:m.25646 g.25646  ORF g.25646 m.25646 type:complete len:1000 (+) comp13601_c0_seq1:1099-4098(+)
MRGEPSSLNSKSITSPSQSRPVYEWAEDLLCQLFQIRLSDTSLAPTSASSPYGLGLSSSPRASGISDPKKYILMTTLLDDIKNQSDGESITVRSVVEQIIVGMLSYEAPLGGFPLKRRSLDLLVDCFERAYSADRTFLPKSRKKQVTTEVMDLCVSYAKICLEVPDMFPTDGTNDLRKLSDGMLENERSPNAISPAFVRALIEKCIHGDSGNTSLETIFTPVVNDLLARARQSTTIEAMLPAVRAVSQLCQYQELATIIIDRSDWLGPPNCNGRQFEQRSFLGPFFRATVIPDCDVDIHRHQLLETFTGSAFFPDAELRPGDIQSSNQTIRRTMSLLRSSLHDIVRNMLRVKTHRPKVLQFFLQAVSLNSKRAQLRAERSVLASDGFALNLTCVLLKLCDPFMQNLDKPKFDKIDGSYLLHPNAALDNSQETRLVASLEETNEWNAQHKHSDPNFITEVFFCTLQALHVCVVPILLKFTHEWNGSNGRMARLRHLLQRLDNDPAAPPEFHNRIRQQLRSMRPDKHCFDAEILNPDVLSHVLHFNSFVAKWLTHMVDPNGRGPPLATPAPMPFASLPDFYVEDITDVLQFLARFASSVTDGNVQSVPLVRFLITFISGREHIHSPYLRAKLVEIIADYAPDRGLKSRFFDLVQSDHMSVTQLAPALMQFYVDVEDTDFYSKLRMRYNAQIVLKDLWRSPKSRQGFIDASQKEEFVRFVMLLINDTTFLLDEARDSLKKIFDFKKRLETSHGGEREEISQSLQQTEGQARSLLQLGYETVNMFDYITCDIVAPFMRPELVNRLAAMLNYNIVALVGPKSAELKVDHPEEYGFNARELLRRLVTIYLNLSRILSSEPVQYEFVKAIAEDGRSYKKDIMNTTVMLLHSMDFAEEKITAFSSLIEKVEDCLKEQEDIESDLGEIPDEYLDPIMATLMRDPVQLPASRTVVDRSTISAHLLSDPSDPFNREHLTIDMVIPDTKLKAEIDAWIEKTLKEAKEKRKT